MAVNGRRLHFDHREMKLIWSVEAGLIQIITDKWHIGTI